MNDIAIQVENMSKLYNLGELHRHTNSFRDSVTRKIRSLMPYFIKNNPIYTKNKLPNSSPLSKKTDQLWALKDVSFEIKKAEIVGIIGSNGAGKSTLLKILSRITKPTSGTALINGNIGSLLEVGTGFHPELTGRENIYLNGAILGMSKTEIKNKFDEIVAFSEIERFLNTPVKRYSSGMYVRLAFAVAAHLEPEILLVDEVLAVGDVNFQKKCLGKMSEVSKGGRTVLFVSHNMAAITSLCNSAILLKNGKICREGDSRDVVQSYLSEKSCYAASIKFDDDPKKLAQITEIQLKDCNGRLSTDFNVITPLTISIKYIARSPVYNHRIGIIVSRNDGVEVFVSNSNDWQKPQNKKLLPGRYVASLHIPACFLKEDQYLLGCYLGEPGNIRHDVHKNILQFRVCGNPFNIAEKRPGMLVYPFQWDVESIV